MLCYLIISPITDKISTFNKEEINQNKHAYMIKIDRNLLSNSKIHLRNQSVKV